MPDVLIRSKMNQGLYVPVRINGAVESRLLPHRDQFPNAQYPETLPDTVVTSYLEQLEDAGLLRIIEAPAEPEVLSMAVTADMGAGFGAVEHEQTLVGGFYSPDTEAVQFTIRVTNTSDALLTLSNVSITGAGLGPTSLEITPPGDLGIQAGNFADFIVDFIAPGIGQAGEGTYAAQITFEHGASNEPSPFEINLNLDCIGAQT